MSDLPDGLDPGRHAELQRRVYEPWARRAFVLILAAAIVAALAGAVGQRSHTSRAVGRVRGSSCACRRSSAAACCSRRGSG